MKHILFFLIFILSLFLFSFLFSINTYACDPYTGTGFPCGNNTCCTDNVNYGSGCDSQPITCTGGAGTGTSCSGPAPACDPKFDCAGLYSACWSSPTCTGGSWSCVCSGSPPCGGSGPNPTPTPGGTSCTPTAGQPGALSPYGTLDAGTYTLTWVAGANATSHKVWVTDITNPSSPVSVVNGAVVNMPTVSYSPVTFTGGHDYSWSVQAINNCGGDSSGIVTITAVAMPNCTNLTGPPTIYLGQSGTYTADFSSPQGNLGAEIDAGQGSTFIWTPGSVGIPGNSGTHSFTWTPSQVGTYDVFGRAWNDAVAECRGKANYVDGPPRYTCAGPNCSMTVNVLPPSPPTGVCQDASFDPATASTPVKWTWPAGDSLQVTRDSPPDPAPADKYWMYNGNPVASGIIVYPPARPYQKYMPPGPTHPVYARIAFGGDWTTPGLQSAVASVTCSVPSFNPLSTISGPLQQKSGTGCYPANATNNFNVQNPTTTTDPSSCVSTTCTALDNNGSPSTTAAAKYTCTTTFSNNVCLNLDPPTWPISATVALTGTAPTGYTLGGWAPSSGICDPLTMSKTVNAGDTINNQPLIFNLTGTNWTKLKNASFTTTSTTNNALPVFINLYKPGDPDDDASQKYFIMGSSPGVALGISSNAYSSTNWNNPSYSKNQPFDASLFLSYVQSRKQFTKITSLDQITTDGIYVWDDSISFPHITNTTTIPDKNFVLISTTQLITIERTNFNPTKSVAIIANSITFSNSAEEATGIFVANTIDIGSTSGQGLKINGNLIARTGFTNNRQWDDTSRPAVFVVIKPNIYLDLLPYLSISKYEQTIQ